MAGFLYFTPSRQLPDELSYAFEGKPIQREVLFGGPNGGAGMLWADRTWDANLHRVGYFAEEQEWAPIAEQIWVGWYRDDRPTEKDLQRKEQLAGHVVKFEDGSEWLMPVARYWHDSMTYQDMLPRLLSMKDGKFVKSDVIPKYRELWKVATEWFDHWNTQTRNGEVTIDEASHWCSPIICANYRATMAELVALGIVSEDTQSEILGAVIDLPGLARKKKQAAQLKNESTARGEPG